MYIFSAVEKCGSSGELRRTIGLLCSPSSDAAVPSVCCLLPNDSGTERSSDLENIEI